jgi:hypothetical protein
MTSPWCATARSWRPRRAFLTDHPTSHAEGAGAQADYNFADQIGHLLRRAYQRHLAIFQAHASDPQVTSIQFATLCALRDNGPSSQSDLIRITGVDQATIRGILLRLKRRGLIDDGADHGDRRKLVIHITEAGLILLEHMIPSARAITEMTLDGLNPAERVALTFLLRKIMR